MSISTESKSILPYENVRGLVFEDENSNQFILNSELGLIDTFWTNCIFKPCAIALVDDTCENLEMESRRIEFENDSLKLLIRLFWQQPNKNNEERDTNFIETIETVFQWNSEFVRTNFISNTRGVNIDSDYFQLIPDTLSNYQLISNTYNEVIIKDNLVWYSKDFGIVGIRIFDTVYELKEIIN